MDVLDNDGDLAQVVDRIPHLSTCTLAPRTMPVHLRRRTWERHENATNARLGLRRTAASGALNLDGDGRIVHRWRLECKLTSAPFYALTQGVWAKLVSGALLAGEEPVLDIEYRFRHGLHVRRTVIRPSLWRAFHPDWAVADPAPRSRVRVHANTLEPEALELDPPGIAVTETDFLFIKRQVDAQLP